jgi:3',5'-cyclic AMP phosphodiesterase CpdA
VKFRFAYISDTHLYERKLNERFVRAALKAVEDVNALEPKPDFVLFGGDLAQLGQPKELELGKEILSEIRTKVYMMVGEHDWYLDLGEKWLELFGKNLPKGSYGWYSFDHKGVHFIVLNSVIVEDYWTKPKMTPMERMKFMAQLDNPKGRPFTVGKGYLGDGQIRWLKKDLSRVSKDTPIVIFSHSPLYKYYKPWNFWTDDAEDVHEILKPFKNVTVIHGHTHQMVFNKIGNINFYGMLSTAWPWPYAPEGLPKISIKFNRADPFDQFDGCGDGTVEVLTNGKADKIYNLWSRDPIKVTARYLDSGGKEDIPPLPLNPSY